jgi:hypothetical protein
MWLLSRGIEQHVVGVGHIIDAYLTLEFRVASETRVNVL